MLYLEFTQEHLLVGIDKHCQLCRQLWQTRSSTPPPPFSFLFTTYLKRLKWKEFRLGIHAQLLGHPAFSVIISSLCYEVVYYVMASHNFSYLGQGRLLLLLSGVASVLNVCSMPALCLFLYIISFSLINILWDWSHSSPLNRRKRRVLGARYLFWPHTLAIAVIPTSS